MSQHHVYRIFDADDALIYIGATSDLMREHRSTKPVGLQSHPVLTVGPRMASWVATEYPTREDAWTAEREAIWNERPELNTLYHPDHTTAPRKQEESDMTLDPDYTLREVADALRVSERWVRDRIRLDGAEHQRKGHKITFSAEQVEKLRAAHTKAPVEQSITTGRKKRTA